ASDVYKRQVSLTVVGESAAGKGWEGTLAPGEAVRIMTGARLPAGADAVQKIELTGSPHAEEGSWETGPAVTILEPTKPGRFIVYKGSEIKQGETVIKAGAVITSRSIAPLAAFGFRSVTVSRQPRVAIMATGSEIVDISETPAADQIRNSNSPMLKALAEDAGAVAEIKPNAGDDLDALTESIQKAAASANILVITGGVSVGKYDLTKVALARLGAEFFFERLRLKPGKPTVFARLGETLVFGLPGNPVSAAVTFYLFVRRAILLMQNAREISLRTGTAILTGDVKGTKERESYLPAKLSTDRNGRLIAKPIKWHGSSDFVGFSSAEALIRVPENSRFEAGDTAEILFLP
ncbi:MAG: molybdopterin molybdotransferase MoeA, partial [Pyrinomonadaceae bacterium]|nr:molybdopterin molybdotransferase MoeA [Pyrinomonadaceae bacterium]